VSEPTVVVGLVTAAHGLRGEVAVQSRSDNPRRWIAGGVVLGPDGRSLTIEAIRRHGARLLVKFAGVDDRTAAESLRGAELVVPESWLPELPAGSWWAHQLEGCAVVTRSGRRLGVLAEVVANPANDIWIARDDTGRETLIPVLDDVLVDVDPGARRIVVDDVPGLTVPDEAGAGEPPGQQRSPG
jgi:16S rRNA processing protein RimM